MSLPPVESIYPLSNTYPAAPGKSALIVGYQGAQYHGWQAQKSGVPSIQSHLEKALAKVANEPIEVVCAGRTDAGVNATQQVVHFDAGVVRSPYSWVMGCNHFLPDDIVVLWAGSVGEDFHARYSATSRTYRYVIYNHPLKPAWAAHSVTWIFQPLDEALMHTGAQYLIGEHDFSSFRGADCQSNTPNRNVTRIEVFRIRDLIVVEIEANAFLHHMVRNIVGSLISVGMRRKKPDWMEELLNEKNRCKAGVTAPPNGLYLVKVDYPSSFGIPILPKGPFFLDG